MKYLYQRKSRGTILSLASLTTALVAVTALVGCSFLGLYLTRTRLQTTANELALAAASQLNNIDQEGQINNTLAGARQLVYVSRTNYQNLVASSDQLTPLANQLLNEDRQSALLVVGQQNAIGQNSITAATAAVQQRLSAIRSTYDLCLPWLCLSGLELESIEFGSLSDFQSNVQAAAGVQALANYDNAKGYVQAGATATSASTNQRGLNLYKAQTNLSLPLDSDINFTLSSLPAPVTNIVAPARVALSQTFVPTQNPGIPPSAVRVTVSLKVGTAVGPVNGGSIQLTGTATTNGGSPPL